MRCPTARKTWPVTCNASSEASHATMGAELAGFMWSYSPLSSSSGSITSASLRRVAVMRVMPPGATALARTP